jgi:hypothetical protein
LASWEIEDVSRRSQGVEQALRLAEIPRVEAFRERTVRRGGVAPRLGAPPAVGEGEAPEAGGGAQLERALAAGARTVCLLAEVSLEARCPDIGRQALASIADEHPGSRIFKHV